MSNTIIKASRSHPGYYFVLGKDEAHEIMDWFKECDVKVEILPSLFTGSDYFRVLDNEELFALRWL